MSELQESINHDISDSFRLYAKRVRSSITIGKDSIISNELLEDAKMPEDEFLKMVQAGHDKEIIAKIEKLVFNHLVDTEQVGFAKMLLEGHQIIVSSRCPRGVMIMHPATVEMLMIDHARITYEANK